VATTVARFYSQTSNKIHLARAGAAHDYDLIRRLEPDEVVAVHHAAAVAVAGDPSGTFYGVGNDTSIRKSNKSF